MKCGISSGSTLFVKVKKIFRPKNTIFFENYNLTPLDMYNGLSQVYCIKPKGKIHSQRVKGMFFFLSCVCYSFVRICLYVPCGHLLGKGWPYLSFVVSNCEFVTFPLVSWVRCGTWLYWFLIFVPLLALGVLKNRLNDTSFRVSKTYVKIEKRPIFNSHTPIWRPVWFILKFKVQPFLFLAQISDLKIDTWPASVHHHHFINVH